MRLRAFAPVLALVAGGCLASKTDIALLQADVLAVRDATVRGDSARRLQIDQVITQVMRSNDSVRALSARLAKLQADVANDHYEMGRQILQIQELSGQSQRRLQELRASLEERAQTAAVAFYNEACTLALSGETARILVKTPISGDAPCRARW